MRWTRWPRRRPSPFLALCWLAYLGVGPAAQAEDLLIARDGARRAGRLASCVGDVCMLGREQVPRAEIAWIGLGRSGPTPEEAAVTAGGRPGVRGSSDRLYLVDGSVVEAAVVGISLGVVTTEHREHDRATVAWVRFADPAGLEVAPPEPLAEAEPEPEEPADPGDLPERLGAPREEASPPEEGDDDAETEDEPADPDVPEEHVDPPRDPAPPPILPSRSGDGELGALWTGTIVGHAHGTVDGVRTDWRFAVGVRLRERRFPVTCPVNGRPRRVGTFVELEPEGSVVTNRFASHGEDVSCRGRGSVTVSAGRGITGAGHASAMWLADAGAIPAGCALPVDVPAGGGVYVIGIGAPHGAEFESRCTSGGESGTLEQGYLTPVIGGGLLGAQPATLCGDPEVRALEDGRTVMRGTARGPCTGCCPRVALSWSICREGAACPPPAALPEPETVDPCDKLGDLPDQRDLCGDQLELLQAGLVPHLQAHTALLEQAKRNEDAFTAVDLQCEVWDRTEDLLKTLISGGAGDLGKAFLYLADLIEKVEAGELHELLYPEQLEKLLEYYALVDEVWTELTADEVTKMQARLESCVGKVDNDTLGRAEKYVADLLAAKKLWHDEVAPGLNDLRTQGLRCAEWDHAVWRACLSEAECRGTPASDCGPEPSLDPVQTPLRPPRESPPSRN